MLNEHRKIIEGHIKESSDFLEKFSDFEIGSNFQLLLSQLDLFKVISGLIIAVVGIGYFYEQNLQAHFLTISVICALLTLFLSISYTREVIDLQSDQNKKTHEAIKLQIDEGVSIAIDSLQKNDASIFFEYAKHASNKKYPEPQLNYSGEIIVFMFYSAVGFLGASFFATKYGFSILSYQTVVLMVLAYFLSFKNWSFVFLRFLSMKIRTKI
jgi:hypothetical protein